MPAPIQGQTILLTGGSSGIGEAAALALAARGARLCLVARRREELERVQAQIRGSGGECWIYPANLADEAELDACAAAVLADHGSIDVLINNAGRSIRRPVAESFDRFHDYQRAMQLNYFAAVKLSLHVLPAMLERRSGQIINISSASTLIPMPRFSAYVASKCALEGFSRSLLAEVGDRGVKVTVVHYPLVKTAMTAPTAAYRYLPQLSPEAAAGWIVEAIEKRPARIARRGAELMNLATAALPDSTIKWTARLMRAGARQLQKRAERETGERDS